MLESKKGDMHQFSPEHQARIERETEAKKLARVEITEAKSLLGKISDIESRFVLNKGIKLREILEELHPEFEDAYSKFFKAKSDLMKVIGQWMKQGEDAIGAPEIITERTQALEQALSEAEAFFEKVDAQAKQNKEE